MLVIQCDEEEPHHAEVLPPRDMSLRSIDKPGCQWTSKSKANIPCGVKRKHTMRKYSTQRPLSWGQLRRPLSISCRAATALPLLSNSLHGARAVRRSGRYWCVFA